MSNLDYKPEHAMEVVQSFQIDGKPEHAYRIHRGHINDTFAVETAETKYVLQRIEHNIFKRPLELMHNIELVLDELHKKIKQDGGDPLRESLTLVNATDGRHYLVTEKGDYWRCYYFIDANMYDYVNNDEHGRHIAYEAAYIFGKFQKHLVNLPARAFYNTIQKFHHTPTRYKQLEEAVKADVVGRAKECRDEIDFAFGHEDMIHTLVNLMETGEIPTVVVHNDTKINNVMFDNTVQPEKALAIIDLDTLMPGTRLYDFGDLVRTTTCPAAEDETDLSKITVDMGLFERLVAGFIDAVGDLLTEAEKRYLAFSGKLITFNIGIRFLTDYLAGDVYFKTSRDSHNLDRARTQFKMIAEMENQSATMEEVVKEHAK